MALNMTVYKVNKQGSKKSNKISKLKGLKNTEEDPYYIIE